MVVYPRVLVAAPIYEGKEYCRKQFVKAMRELDYPNYSFLLVDNSKGTSYYNKLRREGVPVFHVARGTNSRTAVANSEEFIRKRCLLGGFEYLMSIESDLFPPKDIIQKLMSHRKPVVGAPYFIGHGRQRRLCVFNVVKKAGQAFMGTESMRPGEEHGFIGTGLKQVHGCGLGCVLIHRMILDRVAFWYSGLDDERMKGETIRKHPDVYFYLNLQNDLGVKVFVDTNILVDHQNSDWGKVKDL